MTKQELWFLIKHGLNKVNVHYSLLHCIAHAFCLDYGIIILPFTVLNYGLAKMVAPAPWRVLDLCIRYIYAEITSCRQTWQYPNRVAVPWWWKWVNACLFFIHDNDFCDAYIYVLTIASSVTGVVLFSFIFVCFTFVLTDSCCICIWHLTCIACNFMVIYFCKIPLCICYLSCHGFMYHAIVSIETCLPVNDKNIYFGK